MTCWGDAALLATTLAHPEADGCTCSCAGRDDFDVLYKIKWEGYEERTWEPEENVQGATKALEAWKEAKKAKREARKEKAARRVAAEEEAEGEAATAEDMVEPFDLPSTVQKLKLYFPSAASTAGVKPALEQMEREIYGEVKVGALNVRVRALSLEFGGMYTLSRST